MFKRAMTVALVAALAWSGAASAQTYADETQMLDAQILLSQKRKQLQDNLGADPILAKVPQVVSVMTFGAEIKAKLMLANGVALSYGEGEVINSRMRVVAITPREVVVAIIPNDGAKRSGKKAAEPVLLPLEFMAGARQASPVPGMAGGMPGAPGTPVFSGPIPPGLMQAPPPIQGGSPASLPQGASAATGPAQAPAAAVAASPGAVPIQK